MKDDERCPHNHPHFWGIQCMLKKGHGATPVRASLTSTREVAQLFIHAYLGPLSPGTSPYQEVVHWEMFKPTPGVINGQ